VKASGKKISAYRLVFARLITWPWRRGRHLSSKRRLTFNGLHGVISQKIKIFISTAVRTSNLKRQFIFRPKSFSEEWNLNLHGDRWNGKVYGHAWFLSKETRWLLVSGWRVCYFAFLLNYTIPAFKGGSDFLHDWQIVTFLNEVCWGLIEENHELILCVFHKDEFKYTFRFPSKIIQKIRNVDAKVPTRRNIYYLLNIRNI
jgi:hypothetical protein